MERPAAHGRIHASPGFRALSALSDVVGRIAAERLRCAHCGFRSSGRGRDRAVTARALGGG